MVNTSSSNIIILVEGSKLTSRMLRCKKKRIDRGFVITLARTFYSENTRRKGKYHCMTGLQFN